MAKTDTAPEAEKLVEVRLLRNYVPKNAERVEGTDAFKKSFAGEVITLPRDEAKRAIELKIAEITADLI